MDSQYKELPQAQEVSQVFGGSERGNINKSDKLSSLRNDERKCCFCVRYTNEEVENQTTLKGKCIRHKTKLIVVGAILFILALTLILVFALKSKQPEPVPPNPPQPPSPLNPYRLNQTTLSNKAYIISGNLTISDADLEDIKRTKPKTNQESVLDGEKIEVKADPRQIPTGLNNQIFSTVYFELGQINSRVAYVTLTDANSARFSVPEEVLAKPAADPKSNLQDTGGSLLSDGSFGFQFKDPETGEVLVTTKDQSMILMDKYLQVDMVLPSRRIFGLGERKGGFSLGEGTWTMWGQTPNETPAQFDDGFGGKQTYGVHPFALVQTQTAGRFIGIFFRNGNAQSPVITYQGDSQALLSYITIGGQIEIYFIFGGSAKQVIQQYHGLIGKPFLPPLWALGWQASSDAYWNEDLMTGMIDNYKKANIPLEVVCIGDSAQNQNTQFDMNTTTYPNIQKLKANNFEPLGLKIVATVPVGIRVALEGETQYYQRAQNDNLIIMSAINKEQLWGELINYNPKQTVFLDSLDQKTYDLMKSGLARYHSWLPFDGTTINGNVIDTLCDGECPNGPPSLSEVELSKMEGVSSHGWYVSFDSQNELSTFKLPFIPSTQSNLDHRTLSLNGTIKTGNYRQYDMHNLNGHRYGKQVHDVLLLANKDQRPFTLSDSTFAGSGQFMGHWIQHNQKSWSDMKSAVADVMKFSMFGIPMTGAAIGGHYGEDNSELNARWIQLSTFLPLARHSFDSKNGSQAEPFLLPSPYLEWAKNAIFDRLKYMRHMYTCLFEASESAKTCFDPLFYHYPDIDDLFTDPESTFLVGDSLKVSPVLNPVESNTTFQSYFPNDNNGTWVDLNDFSKLIKVDPLKQGQMVDLKVPMLADERMHVHLRPGRLVVTQDTEGQTIFTTKFMQETGKFQLTFNRDMAGFSQGTVFLDSGTSQLELNDKTYEYYKLTLEKNSITKNVLNKLATKSSGLNLQKVKIVNAEDLNSTDFACASTSSSSDMQMLKFAYNATDLTLQITNTTSDPIWMFELKSIYFGDSSKDINLCQPQTQFYRFTSSVQNDNPYQLLLGMASMTGDKFPDLTLDVRALKGGVINMNYNYTDSKSAEKAPFGIPAGFNQINRTNFDEAADVKKYVAYSQPEQGGMTINVKDRTSTLPVFDLTGFLVTTDYQYFEALAYYNEKAAKKGIVATFGQLTADLFVTEGSFGFWTKDDAAQVTGKETQRLQGVHPFFMAQISDGTWYGVYSNVAAAQEWQITNDPDNHRVKIKVNAVGGSGDFYFLYGDNPNILVTKFHSLIGKPRKSAQWALGWHMLQPSNCTMGACGTNIAQRMHYDNIPLDSWWGNEDLEYNYMALTCNDTYQINNMIDVFLNNRAKQQFLLPVPSGISYLPANASYGPFNSGVEKNLFLKDQLGNWVLGQNQRGPVVYPDFMNESTAEWFYDQLSGSPIHKQGYWILNDAANAQCSDQCLLNSYGKQSNRPSLLFRPTLFDIQTDSINLEAQHGSFSELEAHSLFGTSMAKSISTQQYNQRAVIVGSSSFTGYGQFGQIVHGYYSFTEAGLKTAIIQTMSYGISGIPMNGALTCTPSYKENLELCARWFMASAYQPMSIFRDIYSTDWKDVDYEDGVSYYKIIDSAMGLKMNFYRYFSNQLVTNTDKGGVNLMKPLWMEFPDDPESYNADQAQNFMIGNALKVSLGTTPGQNTTDFYFPPGGWCSLFNYSDVQSCFTSKGEYKSLPSKAYNQNVHIRQGTIIPFQNQTQMRFQYGWENINSVRDMQDKPTTFLIYPLCNETFCIANGSFINDDGMSSPRDGDTNVYNLSWVQDLVNSPNNLTFFFNRSVKCSSRSLDVINKNDYLVGTYVFNASAMGLNDKGYTVYQGQEFGDSHGDKYAGNAYYNEINDRFNFNWSGPDAGYVTIAYKFTYVKDTSLDQAAETPQ